MSLRRVTARAAAAATIWQMPNAKAATTIPWSRWMVTLLFILADPRPGKDHARCRLSAATKRPGRQIEGHKRQGQAIKLPRRKVCVNSSSPSSPSPSHSSYLRVPKCCYAVAARYVFLH